MIWWTPIANTKRYGFNIYPWCEPTGIGNLLLMSFFVHFLVTTLSYYGSIFAFLSLFFFSQPHVLTFQQWTMHPCTVHRSHKLHFSATFSLKMGSTALFTHLKIILLQYFQFSVFSFSKIILSKWTLSQLNIHKSNSLFFLKITT